MADTYDDRLGQLQLIKGAAQVLQKICATTAEDVERRKAQRSLADVKAMAADGDTPRGFHKALEAKHAAGDLALIAEIKKASPSKGLIRPDFNPPVLAKAYEDGGASCLSILTDEAYFQGHDDFLLAARKTVALPCLRKDFMIDPYQIYESRALGADCVLLMLSVMEDGLIQELEGIALELGMDALIEIHDQEELDRAMALKSPLFGINNRNLKTLEVSLDTFRDLAAQVPADRFLVAESGLYDHQDLMDMSQHGAKGFLIGESLMRKEDVRAATAEILGKA